MTTKVASYKYKDECGLKFKDEGQSHRNENNGSKYKEEKSLRNTFPTS